MEKNSNNFNPRLNVLKGEITESYAKRLLQDKGYKVRKIANLDRKTNIYELDYPVLKEFFLKSNKDFSKEVKFFEENIKGLPDFICLKGKRIRFIEVKSNKTGIQENQKEVFELLRKEGYSVGIIRIKVNLELEKMGFEEAKLIELERQNKGYLFDLEGIEEGILY